MNCFSKHYKYLAYANTLYTYLLNPGQKVDQHIKDNYEDFKFGIEDEETQ